MPDELRPKAGYKHFEAIFVGYKEVCIGWRVCDLKGKSFFSRDIIFNEELSGRLGLPRSFPDACILDPSSPSSRPSGVRTCTLAGQAFDEVIWLKEFHKVERTHLKGNLLPGAVDGGGHALAAVDVRMGVDLFHEDGGGVFWPGGAVSALFPPSLIEDVSPLIEDIYLTQMEPGIIVSFAWHASASSFARSFSFDLSKAPSSFAEAHARSDASVW